MRENSVIRNTHRELQLKVKVFRTWILETLRKKRVYQNKRQNSLKFPVGLKRGWGIFYVPHSFLWPFSPLLKTQALNLGSLRAAPSTYVFLHCYLDSYLVALMMHMSLVTYLCRLASSVIKSLLDVHADFIVSRDKLREEQKPLTPNPMALI